MKTRLCILGISLLLFAGCATQDRASIRHSSISYRELDPTDPEFDSDWSLLDLEFDNTGLGLSTSQEIQDDAMGLFW